MAVTEQVEQLAQLGRAQTVALTDQQVVDLTRAWVDAWDTLAPEMEAVLEHLAQQSPPLTPAQIARDRRVVQALTQAQSALEELQAAAAERTVQDVEPAVLAAADAHYAALQAQLPPAGYWPPGFQLVQYDEGAVAAIVARTTQQIHSQLEPLSSDAIAAMRAELVRGTALGNNPRPVARRILRRTEGAFNGGLVRATRIARTEMLDAYRHSSRASARANSSLIAAQVWIARLDTRTCGSCLAQHGTEWPPEAFGPEDHQNGRCVFAPKTRSWEELGFVGIEEPPAQDMSDRDEWWDNLSPAAQDRVLGPARAQLLRDGAISWPDLTARRTNPDWRDSYHTPPLRDLSP